MAREDHQYCLASHTIIMSQLGGLIIRAIYINIIYSYRHVTRVHMCVYGFFLEIKYHCTRGGMTVLCGLKINMESPLLVPFSCNSAHTLFTYSTIRGG